jgi:hypothetical protein
MNSAFLSMISNTSAARSPASISALPRCRCGYKGKIAGWIKDFNVLYDTTLNTDLAIDWADLPASMNCQFGTVKYTLCEIHRIVNDPHLG